MHSNHILFCLSAFLSAVPVAYASNLSQWGPLIDFPLVPVAAALLYDTGDLLWSAY
jgi:galactose oxidase